MSLIQQQYDFYIAKIAEYFRVMWTVDPFF